MPVLVTGASGFLGGRLAKMLAQRGEQVTVLARPRADLQHLSALGRGQLQIVRGSLTDEEQVLRAVQDVTHIYHCAAASTDWAPREVYLESNVRGTEALLRAAKQARGLRRFLHVSTTDVYGYPAVPCAESGPLRAAGMPYNETKILAEQAVWRAQEEGVPVTVIRPATIYGPRGNVFVADIAALLGKRQMAYINGGRSTGGFVYVDNAVDAMLAAADRPGTLGQAYNLSDDTRETWRGYVEALAGGLGCKPPWIDLSFKTAMALASGMETTQRFFRPNSGRPMLTRHAVHLLGRDQEFPISKLRAAIGFVPQVSFAEGVERSVAWVRDSRSV